MKIVKAMVLAIIVLSIFIPVQAVVAAGPGTTYTVNPGQSIQKTLNRMSAGDICIVNPGTYNETLNIPTSGLTIEGKGSPVIDAGGAVNAVLIDNIADTTLKGLIIKNSDDSLILITGPGAKNNRILQSTLLEWSLADPNENHGYPSAVDLQDGASYTTIDSNFMYRGNHEYINGSATTDQQAVGFRNSAGHHSIANNIVVGVALDIDPTLDLPAFTQNLSQNIYRHAIKIMEDFGDGYPRYKLNLGDGLSLGDRFVESADFDYTTFSGNQLFGAHDNMIEIQAADRNTTITKNYIDVMGGGGAIAIRSGSVGPINISENIILNFGIDAFKYGSWSLGSGNAEKQINNNIFYSTLGRGYGGTEWYTPVIDTQIASRIFDGEVNGADYNNLHADGNRSLSRNAFIVLMPGSGTNNSFTNNRFSTLSGENSPVKWFGSYIDFAGFNSLNGGSNTWEVIPKPEAPAAPRAGAQCFNQ